MTVSRRRLAKAAHQIRSRGVEPHGLLASSLDPPGEPLCREIRVPGAESPRARSHHDLESQLLEGVRRGSRRVGPDEASAGGLASLVVVERVHQLPVKGLGGGQFDVAHDAEREQSRASRSGTDGDETSQLFFGEHVQQGGGGDQGGPRPAHLDPAA